MSFDVAHALIDIIVQVHVSDYINKYYMLVTILINITIQVHVSDYIIASMSQSYLFRINLL